MTNDVLTPKEAAEYLGVNPHSIRVQAHANPSQLGFPVTVVGNRVLIPRVPLMRFLGLEET